MINWIKKNYRWDRSLVLDKAQLSHPTGNKEEKLFKKELF